MKSGSFAKPPRARLALALGFITIEIIVPLVLLLTPSWTGTTRSICVPRRAPTATLNRVLPFNWFFCEYSRSFVRFVEIKLVGRVALFSLALFFSLSHGREERKEKRDAASFCTCQIRLAANHFIYSHSSRFIRHSGFVMSHVSRSIAEKSSHEKTFSQGKVES